MNFTVISQARVIYVISTVFASYQNRAMSRPPVGKYATALPSPNMAYQPTGKPPLPHRRPHLS